MARWINIFSVEAIARIQTALLLSTISTKTTWGITEK
jgi:hypothetical protein